MAESILRYACLGEAFRWAERVGHVMKLPDTYSECCPIVPSLQAESRATAYQIALGVGAKFLVALYALLLTVFSPLFFLVGCALYFCSEELGKDLCSAFILFPMGVIIALAQMFTTIAAHTSEQNYGRV